MDCIVSTNEDSLPAQADMNLARPSAADPGRKRGRPRGSKNLPTSEARMANKRLLAQAHYERKKKQTNNAKPAAAIDLVGPSAVNSGRKRGRPRGSKNLSTLQRRAHEQILAQAHDPERENGPSNNAEEVDAIDLVCPSAVNSGRKRGRPRGSKNLATLQRRAHEQILAQAHHERENERTNVAKVASQAAFSDMRQQHVAQMAGDEMQELEASGVDQPLGMQGSGSPCSTDRGLNQPRDLRTSADIACSPIKASRKGKKYGRLDHPGPSNVPYKDAAAVAASRQWRTDRETQARLFAQLEGILAEDDKESIVGSLPRRRRRHRLSARRVSSDTSKAEKTPGLEADAQDSCTDDGVGSDDSDGNSDDGELHCSASWVPLSVASRPIGFLGQVRHNVGFLPKLVGTEVGVPQALLY